MPWLLHLFLSPLTSSHLLSYCFLLLLPSLPHTPSDSHHSIRNGMKLQTVIVSTSPSFADLSMLTDCWIPACNLWIGDFPFLNKKEFVRFSRAWRRSDGYLAMKESEEEEDEEQDDEQSNKRQRLEEGGEEGKVAEEDEDSEPSDEEDDN